MTMQIRFLEDGINRQAYMPFGIGNRMCLGKNFENT